MSDNPQSAPVSSGITTSSDSTKKVLPWLGLILLCSALIAGIIGYIVKIDSIPTILIFVSIFATLIITILQVDKKAFSFIVSEIRIGIQVVGSFLLIMSLGLNVFLFLSHFHYPSSNPPMPTRTNPVKVQTAHSVVTTTPLSVALKQKIGVPSYFDPGSEGWTQMEQSASTSSLAIINPDSGPGTSRDQNYEDQVSQAKNAGMQIIGYVATAYAGTQDHTRTLAAVERDVDTYYRWYPNIDGIFVDEVSTDCSKASSYYKPLYDYIKQKGEAVTVVLDPGTNTSECYMDAGDIIVNFDDTYANYINWFPSPWVQKYPASHFWQIVAGVSSTNMMQAITYSKNRNAGWIYMTNESGANPFESLPSYWNNELREANTP